MTWYERVKEKLMSEIEAAQQAVHGWDGTERRTGERRSGVERRQAQAVAEPAVEPAAAAESAAEPATEPVGDAAAEAAEGPATDPAQVGER